MAPSRQKIWVSKAAEALLALLFPPKCPFCRRLLAEGEDLLCPECQRELPWTQGEQGKRKVEFSAGCIAPLWFQDRCREAVHRFKFRGMQCYSEPFSTLMAQCARDRLSGTFDLVTWVPVSRRRRWERGYDQGELLARGVARELELSFAVTLRKIRHNKKQSLLTGAAARRANVLGAYAVRDAALVRDKRVLLVDDVVTTGATLGECARMLRTAGAREVVCLALTMAGQDERAAGKKV